MTRSPLFYPLNRGMDSEAGGVADLQTDVMRFMAILALCLVAIFALVQSIPLEPVTPVESPPEAPVPVSEPDVVKPDTVPPAKPLPLAAAPPEPTPLKPVPPEPVPPEPVPPVTATGFTLRFETDAALTRLVARHEVGLYAIGSEASLRLNVTRGRLSFWPASTPNKYHEMDTSTVPDDVVLALQRSSAQQDVDRKWGVTLPAGMQDQLTHYLNDAESGSMVITADGNIRLEQ